MRIRNSLINQFMVIMHRKRIGVIIVLTYVKARAKNQRKTICSSHAYNYNSCRNASRNTKQKPNTYIHTQQIDISVHMSHIHPLITYIDDCLPPRTYSIHQLHIGIIITSSWQRQHINRIITDDQHTFHHLHVVQDVLSGMPRWHFGQINLHTMIYWSMADWWQDLCHDHATSRLLPVDCMSVRLLYIQDHTISAMSMDIKIV